MGSAREFAMVERLVAEGLNDCDVSRRTGIPRTTVRTGDRTASRSESCGWLPETPTSTTFTRLPRTYAHLLGLYLGDGCISQHPPPSSPSDHARFGLPDDHLGVRGDDG